MSYLRTHTVYERQALCHHLAAGLTGQVLTLVVLSMQTVQIVLFLCLLKPVSLPHQFIGILKGCLKERSNGVQYRTAVTVYTLSAP